MTDKPLKDSVLVTALTDVLADLSDLVQKELRLARAEIGAKITSKLHASGWIAAAAALLFIAALLAVEAIVFGLASFGLALHWACALVAVFFAAAGLVTFSYGRSLAEEELFPSRTIRQVTNDLATAKEQVT
jgi:hypothetical protein